MVEEDRDDHLDARELISGLRDGVEAMSLAVDDLDGRIADRRSQLEAERDKAARQSEAKRRREEAEQVRAELAEYRASTVRMVDRLHPLAPVVPTARAAIDNLERVGRELAVGVEVTLVDTDSYIAQVQGGHAPIRIDPPAPSAPATPPKVERRTVIAMMAAKWMDGGEIVTCGRLCQAHLPVEVAERALALGNAIEPTSDVYMRLRQSEPQQHGWFSPDRCAWIDQPVPAPKPLEVHASERPVHSAIAPPAGYAGAAIIGTVTVQRAR